MININTALITGASSGIGYAFAEQLAAKKVNLILIARDLNKLSQIKTDLESSLQIKVEVLSCDLTQSDAPEIILNFLDSKNIIPDLFINNAGAGVYGKFKDTELSREIDIIKLNVIAATSLCKMIVNKMLENGRGHILNVSSSLASRPSPDWAVYAATKAYLFSFTKSISLELINTNVKISLLCPGRTKTEFDNRAKRTQNQNSNKMSADVVAAYSLNQLFKGKKVIIHGTNNKINYFLFKILPNFILEKIITYKK